MSKPSEKAMQAAREFLGSQPEVLVIALATTIDVHTAEALAEHVRVLDMAEKALSVAKVPWNSLEEYNHTIAAITKLKGAK